MPHPEILYWAPTPDCATAAARFCDGWLSEFAPLCGFADDYVERLWADGDGTEDDAVAAAKAVRSVHLAERILASDTRLSVMRALYDNAHLPLHVRFRACLVAERQRGLNPTVHNTLEAGSADITARSLLSTAQPDDLVDLAERVNLDRWLASIAANERVDVNHFDRIVSSIRHHREGQYGHVVPLWSAAERWGVIARQADLDLNDALLERCMRECPADVLHYKGRNPAFPLEARRRCAEHILEEGYEPDQWIVAKTPGLDIDHYRRARELTREGADERIEVEYELSQNPDVDLEIVADLPSTNGAAVARVLAAWADERPEVWGLAAAAEPSDDITAAEYVEAVIAATT